MRKLRIPGVCFLLFLHLPGCVDIPDTSSLLPVGTPFVARGTMTVGGINGACLVWRAENGLTYFLYQDPLLDNNSFDRITAPGATSRLVIATRSDLPSGCNTDAVAQVQEVLEIVE